MDDELKQAVLEIIQDGRDIASAHAPAVIQDTLLWAQVHPLLPLLYLALALPAFIWCVRRFMQYVDAPSVDEAPFLFGAIVSGLLAACAALYLLVTLRDALHAWVAPHSYLVSHFMGA